MHYSLFLVLSLFLQHARFAQSVRPYNRIPILTVNEYKSAWHSADNRLILLDNDGVLLPQHGRNDHDVKKAQDLLEALARDPKNTVWVITARGFDHVQEQYRVLRDRKVRLNLAGQLGTESRKWSEDTVRIQEGARDDVAALHRSLVEATGATFMPRNCCILYPKNKGQNDKLVLKEMQRLAGDFTFEPNSGDHATLTHPTINKGGFARDLFEKHERKTFVMSFGDADIDEKMHEAVNNSGFQTAVSTYVNTNGQSAARTRLDSHHDVHRFFREMVGPEWF
uniref:PIG15p n=1 Tax=Uromyces fabae TaxID=55588 RepID=Q334H7_UROFA|nr:PIG15p [Uromyces viciae-fabae]